MCLKVKVGRTFRFVAKSGFHLDLENTFYIPLFFRNLVSIAKLVPLVLSSYLKT